VIADNDNDGWPDIFVANDLQPNLLYHNLGRGKFEETALVAGAAFSEDGIEEGSMGVDFGDFNNDGWLDLYYTDQLQQKNRSRLRNLGRACFRLKTASCWRRSATSRPRSCRRTRKAKVRPAWQN
jgi:hypothetical protein